MADAGDTSEGERVDSGPVIAHLIFIQHGMWGSPSHTGYVAETFINLMADVKHVKVVNSDVVSGRTGALGGIRQCGATIAEAIKQAATQLRQAAQASIVYISVFGYSLGGILLRYAVGDLLSHRFLTGQDDIDVYALRSGDESYFVPGIFMTAASPHIGARRSPNTMWGRLRNAVLGKGHSWVGGQTGKELALHDECQDSFCIPCRNSAGNTDTPAMANVVIASANEERGGGAPNPNSVCQYQPLLVQMADPSSRYYRALSLFRARILVSNIEGDRAVGFRSASILPLNPYNRDQDAFQRHQQTSSKVYKHVYCDWVSEADAAGNDSPDTIALGQAQVPRWVFTVPEAVNAFPNDDKQGQLLSMIEHLNQLSWRRIDVNFKSMMSHGIIVNRIPWYNAWGQDAITYACEQFVHSLRDTADHSPK